MTPVIIHHNDLWITERPRCTSPPAQPLQRASQAYFALLGGQLLAHPPVAVEGLRVEGPVADGAWQQRRGTVVGELWWGDNGEILEFNCVALVWLCFGFVCRDNRVCAGNTCFSLFFLFSLLCLQCVKKACSVVVARNTFKISYFNKSLVPMCMTTEIVSGRACSDI